MFAIEKDEEYYPQFTQCIKDTLNTVFSSRAERLGEANPYNFAEGKEDEAIASGLEAVKLAELRESDLDLYSVLAK